MHETLRRLILLSAGLLVICGCTPNSFKERASADCDAKSIAAKLGDIDRMRHKNVCMRAAGYVRNNVCDGLPVSMTNSLQCFSPEWQFWVERATIFE
jgi:hypothetical protein